MAMKQKSISFPEGLLQQMELYSAINWNEVIRKAVKQEIEMLKRMADASNNSSLITEEVSSK